LTNNRSFSGGYFQQFITGTQAQLSYGSTRSTVNSPFFAINPFTSGFLDLFVQQPLLQGFGIASNNRYIRVARNNMKVSGLQLKRQVITTVSALLNLYWDLVSFTEDVRIKEQALETAQNFWRETNTRRIWERCLRSKSRAR
jgi:outer membrane protein TolC